MISESVNRVRFWIFKLISRNVNLSTKNKTLQVSFLSTITCRQTLDTQISVNFSASKKSNLDREVLQQDFLQQQNFLQVLRPL